MLRNSAHSLPFPNQRFDLVLSLDALTQLGDRERVVCEARRVLKPAGLLLFGDFIKASLENARVHVNRLAGVGGFQVQAFRDVTAGVVASLDHDHVRKEALIRALPSFVRLQMAETMTLKGTERYGQWQSGERCFFMALLRA